MKTRLDILVEQAVQRHVRDAGLWLGFVLLLKNRPGFNRIAELADGNASDRVVGMQLDRELNQILKTEC